MMLPNVFEILKSAPAIATKVATRIYRHGSAPQDVVRPYITWQLTSNVPFENVSKAPCGDKDSCLINCWSDGDTEVEAIAYAVRDALDSNLIANRIVVNLRETDTKLYRISIEADFISSR